MTLFKDIMRTLLLLLALLIMPSLHAADTYQEIKWEELVPKGWDPTKEFKALNLATLQDSDPRAMEALEKMKALFDNAPTEPSLAGKKIRLPGFAIPLERKGELTTEFLLVPYFGACIHTPPPPANQIIHAVLAKPIKLRSMDPVWASGTLSIKTADTPWGKAGYRFAADKVVPYEEPKKK
jgi:hypothetical protein